MKQLMDWLSNSHWTPDTGMLTYLFLSNGTQANGNHSCPVRRRFEEFTSHQLDLRRPTVHANLALKMRTKRTCDAGAPIVRCLLRRIQKANTPALLPALTLQLLRPLRSGSPRQRLGWPFCCPAKSVKETRSVKSPTWACQPVQTTPRRLKTNAEDSQSHIKIHAVSRN